MISEQQVLWDTISVLEIEYVRGSEDPGRVFRSMSALIDAVTALDKDLAISIDAAIESSVLLEDIETGSIRAILRTVLTASKHQHFRVADWEPRVGHYLSEAKHRVFSWLGSRKTIESPHEIKDLQGELLDLAVATDAAPLNAYAPIPVNALLQDLQQVGVATAELRPGDSIIYTSAKRSTPVNREFRLPPEQRERLLVAEITSSEAKLVLVVKKPDFLGASQWEFKYDKGTIEAKILHDEWLSAFQSGDVKVPPGAALLARVRTEMVRSADGAVTSVKHYVDEVLRVIENIEAPRKNLDLPFEDDAA